MPIVKIHVKEGVARVAEAPPGWPFHHTDPVQIRVTYFDVDGAAAYTAISGAADGL